MGDDFPYKLFEPFTSRHFPTWLGEFSQLNFPCWVDQVTLEIALFLVCIFIVGCVNSLGRRQRRGHAVFWSMTMCLIWTTNLFGLYGQHWLYGSFRGHGQLARFDRQPVDYVADLYFGLHGMNMTVTVHDTHNSSSLVFVEHIPWASYSDRYYLVRSFLERGVVNPILTVMDYYSAPGSLCMGSDLRRATMITQDLLYFSMAATTYLMIQLAFIPEYISYGLMANGFCLLIAGTSFVFKDPKTSARMHIEGRLVELQYGWTCYMVFAAAAVMTAFGMVLWVYRYMMGKLSVRSPWEADLGTPYYWKGQGDGLPLPPLEKDGSKRLRTHFRSFFGKKTPRTPANTPARSRQEIPGLGIDDRTPAKQDPFETMECYGSGSEDEDPDSCLKQKLSFRRKLAAPNVIAFRLSALNLAAQDPAPATPCLPVVVRSSWEDYSTVDVGVTPDSKEGQTDDEEEAYNHQKGTPETIPQAHLENSPASPSEVITDSSLMKAAIESDFPVGL